MNLYLKIKNNEISKKVKEYNINKTELQTYYNVGELLIYAQGSSKRANYGDRLKKEYLMQ